MYTWRQGTVTGLTNLDTPIVARFRTDASVEAGILEECKVNEVAACMHHRLEKKEADRSSASALNSIQQCLNLDNGKVRIKMKNVSKQEMVTQTLAWHNQCAGVSQIS
jgi:hypothetical protein